MKPAKSKAKTRQASRQALEIVASPNVDTPGPVRIGQPPRTGSPLRPLPAWRLPSGQLLMEYALRAGFASSPLLTRFPFATPAASDDAARQSSVVRSLRGLTDAVAASQPAEKVSRKAKRVRHEELA